MSNEPNIHIKIEKKLIDGNELCETSFYGDMFTLSSLVFSSMLSNPKFADVIVEAAKTYIIEHTDKNAILN
jgi:hypothetical protein